MNILRDRARGESFDYPFLMDCLSEYKSPRSKITHLLRSGEIIRIKKGLYVFGLKHRRSMLSLEILANQIYGPSYVSCEYALAFYGLIPEHVVEVTSVTTKRYKHYETPVGRFSYTPLPSLLFSAGFNLLEVVDHQSALIATPEKALADLLYIRKIKIKILSDLEALLFDDLRLDREAVKKFRVGVLSDIARIGGSPVLSLIINWLRSHK